MKEDIEVEISQNPAVAVITYSLDDSGVLDKVGIVTEKNPLFPGGVYQSVVVGTLEEDDESMLERAMQETQEEAGYVIEDSSRWSYLGEIYTSKQFRVPLYCYCVDVTGIDNDPPTGDGSEEEKGIQFSMESLDKVRIIPDALLQSLFMKLFFKLYQNFF
jgi:8-oxo-dGTP pyrophosphatase MutT (NUDIX family)